MYRRNTHEFGLVPLVSTRRSDCDCSYSGFYQLDNFGVAAALAQLFLTQFFSVDVSCLGVTENFVCFPNIVVAVIPTGESSASGVHVKLLEDRSRHFN